MPSSLDQQSYINSAFMSAGIGAVIGLSMVICWPHIPEGRVGTIATVLTAFATLIAALVALHAAHVAMVMASTQEKTRKAELAQAAKALAFAIHQELWDVFLIARAIEKRSAEGPKSVWELRKHYRRRVSIPILLSNAQTLGWFEPDVGASLGSSIGSVVNLRKLLFAPIATGRILPPWYVSRLVEAGRQTEVTLSRSCGMLERYYGVPSIEAPQPSGDASPKVSNDQKGSKSKPDDHWNQVMFKRS